MLNREAKKISPYKTGDGGRTKNPKRVWRLKVIPALVMILAPVMVISANKSALVEKRTEIAALPIGSSKNATAIQAPDEIDSGAAVVRLQPGDFGSGGDKNDGGGYISAVYGGPVVEVTVIDSGGDNDGRPGNELLTVPDGREPDSVPGDKTAEITVVKTSAKNSAPEKTPEKAQEPQKIAYITIDDGPSRAITPKILDLLEAEGIKATFFVLPHNKLDDIYQRIIDEGHEIGNHSYSHKYSSLYSSRDIEMFRDDVIQARDYIYDKFGYLTVSYRFPGGPMGRSASVIEPRREILKELGYNEFAWSVDTGDARAGNTDKSADALVYNVLHYTRNREKLIILMHDTQSRRTTLEALPRIIQGLREQGYTFDILRNYYKGEVKRGTHIIPVLE